MKYKHKHIRLAMTLLTIGVATKVIDSHPRVKEAICHPIRCIRNGFKDDNPRVIEVRVIDERES